MLKLNISNEFVAFRDIKREQLPEILSWYNNIQEFKYATGVDKPISMKCMIERFEEAAICSREFFVGIYSKYHSQMVGILKGRIKNSHPPVVWINSIAVEPMMRRRGYGTKSVELLLSHLNYAMDANYAYASVVEENASGINFWYSAGFVQIRRIEGYLQMGDKKCNVIIMQKLMK